MVKLLSGLGEQGLRAFAAAGPELWTRFGYTRAQEGRAAAPVVEVMKKIAAEGGFKIDIVAYPDVMDAIDWAFENNIQILTHSNGEAASDLLIAAVKDATTKHGSTHQS